MEGAPIFRLCYFDHNWESLRSMELEEATYAEVLAATAAFIAFAELWHRGVDISRHPLREACGLTLEVRSGEEGLCQG